LDTDQKKAESEPWERLCVDMIGPYMKKRKGKKNFPGRCVTMKYLASSWIEKKHVDNREVHTLARIVEQNWKTKYMLPKIVVFDKGTVCMGDFTQMVAKHFDVEQKVISVGNSKD
jgi:hypothetical protein